MSYIPDSTTWRINDWVDIGPLHHLHINAAYHDARCTAYSLTNDNGDTLRYISGQTEATFTGQKRRIFRLVDMQLPFFH